MDQANIVAYVTDYDMVSQPNAWTLAQKVTEQLKKGYVVFGQPFVDKDGNLCQAVVKMDERFKSVIDKALDQMTKALD